ncbi:hypothetical protein HPP92_001647 [Vanilla planifolia]|uniref:Kinesin motor domain-containing protein n=1 Tax=Vanilla planifolia TaxID=51239 RepID=A0A835RZP8_VANPL|nr:hypothetical protein HPP92_001647 [Vanilla planifolia]
MKTEQPSNMRFIQTGGGESYGSKEKRELDGKTERTRSTRLPHLTSAVVGPESVRCNRCSLVVLYSHLGSLYSYSTCFNFFLGLGEIDRIGKTIGFPRTWSAISRDQAKRRLKMEDSTGYTRRGLSVTFSDLSMPTSCSPEVPNDKIQNLPVCRTRKNIDLSNVENFDEVFKEGTKYHMGSTFEKQEVAPGNQLPKGISNLEAALKLPRVLEIQDTVLSINAGGADDLMICATKIFEKDKYYIDGDIIYTDVQIGDGRECTLYQSARFGDFSYRFPNMDEGDYLIDLHLAEIVFTDGPPGMRIFDVYIQNEKTVSNLDIYATVGPNKPLILSNLEALVSGPNGISISFKGIVGKPILCGISIRKGKKSEKDLDDDIKFLSRSKEETITMDNCCNCKKLRRHCDLLSKEQSEMRTALESTKRENELKSQEFHEAWTSLQELQMELMRKSMHVGSLAFAVEGQVKEKSKWCQCLGDLSEKFKMMKLEHSKLTKEALEYKKCLADMAIMTNSIVSKMGSNINLVNEYQCLKLKFIEESKERKELYNRMIELKGNIRVFCRCRPLSVEEIGKGDEMALDFELAKDGELVVKANGAPKKMFKFDAVFCPDEDQEKVFEKTSHLSTSVLDGYNVCIFAYGQTGTGKTFTMEGTKEARGVNYRTLEELFRVVRERQGLFQYEISVSVLEVYNEQIHDLLLLGNQPGVTTKRLEVRKASEGLHHVPGLVEAHVNNLVEAWEVLQAGSKARSIGSTNANEHSSRSHCIHCVMVRGANLMNGECTRSKLWLIDLAGSERIAKTDAQGERLKEAQSINKSLAALGDVISALANKSPHIPFRNSKLTHLLQDSLGGDSKTLMFVQISPCENDVSETLCSLNFATRVRGIELGLAKKQFDNLEVFKNKQMVEKAKQEIKYKDFQIKKMEETICSLESKNKAKDLLNKNLQEKLKELESQLLIERKLARQHVDSKIAENQQQKQQQKQLELNSSFNFVPPYISRPLMEKDQNSAIDQSNVLDSTFPSSDADVLSLFNPQKEDKENKPEIVEDNFLRTTSRALLEKEARRMSMTPANRRDSLIPPPSAKAAALPYLLSQLPLKVMSTNGNASEDRNCSQEAKRSNKKMITSILRRSLQKKLIIRSPLPQSTRGNAVGEKLRVSIGNSGWKSRRVPGTDASKADKAAQQKRLHKEKERGWNLGTARNAF